MIYSIIFAGVPVQVLGRLKSRKYSHGIHTIVADGCFYKRGFVMTSVFKKRNWSIFVVTILFAAAVAAVVYSPKTKAVILPAHSVDSLTLISAGLGSGKDIKTLSANDSINLCRLATNKLSIRANTSPGTVAKVKFTLDSDTNYHTEYLKPYTLNGNLLGWAVKVPELNIVGAHTITATPYNILNQAGQPKTVVLMVNNDCVAPVIAPHSDVTVPNDSGLAEAVVGYEVSALDNVDPNVMVSCSPSSGSKFAIGTTKVTCNASDAMGNLAAPITFDITVMDSEPPVIVLLGENPIIFEVGSSAYDDPGVSVSDNVDPGIEASATGSVDLAHVGQYTITYNAADLSGNLAETKTRVVSVVDTQRPIIKLIGENVSLFVGSMYKDQGATALDTYDGDITENIVTDAGKVDTTKPGKYIVSYNVADSSENVAETITRTVTVNSLPAIITVPVATATRLVGTFVAGTHTANVTPTPTLTPTPTPKNDALSGNQDVTEVKGASVANDNSLLKKWWVWAVALAVTVTLFWFIAAKRRRRTE